MSDLIELIGSTVIAGYVILIVFALNAKVSSSASQYYQDTFNQQSAITSAQIIEDDFYKIGYKATGNKIVQADSSLIKYVSDYNDNGTIDTISYYLSNTSAMSSTTNPNDKLLYRKINQNVYTSAIVTRFYLQYFDSVLNNLSYASLTSMANLARIRTIRVLIRTELADPIDSSYAPVEWRKEFRPRNLQ